MANPLYPLPTNTSGSIAFLLNPEEKPSENPSNPNQSLNESPFDEKRSTIQIFSNTIDVLIESGPEKDSNNLKGKITFQVTEKSKDFLINGASKSTQNRFSGDTAQQSYNNSPAFARLNIIFDKQIGKRGEKRPAVIAPTGTEYPKIQKTTHQENINSQRIETLMTQATKNINEKKYDSAEKNLRKLLTLNPKLEVSPRLLLASCLRLQNKNFEALFYLNLAVQNEPNNSIALRARGNCLAATGNYQKALEDFLKIQGKYSQDKDFLVKIHFCYVKLNKHEEAFAIQQKIKRLTT